MKILFCIAPSDMKVPFLQQPVEVLYTATLLQQRGHDVVILDFRIRHISLEEIAACKAELIFLVTQTYDLSQCYSLTLNGAKATVQHLHTVLPGVPIVTVGMHGSIESEVTAHTLETNLTLPGELEAAIPWLVEHYQNDPAFLTKPLSLQSVPQQADPAALPVPNYSLIDLEAYRGEVVDLHHQKIRYGKAGLIFANRGCPYPCAFCFVWFGKKIRYRPASLVVAELKQQVALGINNFFFLDYTFTLDKGWVRQLCAQIKEANLSISWVCQTRCECVDPSLLKEMKEAGCSGVFYGVESPWIAETNMGKPISRHTIDRAIQETNAAGMQCFLFILLGLENQDALVSRQLIDWLAQVPALFHYSLLLPRPHTTLWNTHTGSDMRINSWEDFATISQIIGREHYWNENLDEFLGTVQQLPNYVVNALSLGA